MQQGYDICNKCKVEQTCYNGLCKRCRKSFGIVNQGDVTRLHLINEMLNAARKVCGLKERVLLVKNEK